MKYILLLSLCLIISPIWAQVVISGKIQNYDGESILYINHALEGIHPFLSESDKVTPKSNGEFLLSFENPGIGMARVHINGFRFAFVHDATSKIYFEIDQDDLIKGEFTRANYTMMRDSARQQAIIRIDGSFKAYNQFLNMQPRTNYGITRSVSGNPYSLMLAAEDDPERFMAIFDSLKTRELNLLSNVMHMNLEGDASEGTAVDDFLEMEINTFYSNIVLNALLLKRIRQVRGMRTNPDTTLNVYHRGWEQVHEDFVEAFKAQPQYANSFSYNEAVQVMNYEAIEYRNYYLDESYLTWDEVILKEFLQPQIAADSILNLNEDVMYAFQLANFRKYVIAQQFYSPVLKQAIDSMKKWHPGSEHLATLEPYFEKVDEYLSEVDDIYEKAVVIEENYTTLDGLLEKFRGKTVLIDVWATWCHPCIGEFAYKNSLNDLLQSGELTMLYISIDKERWEKRWRENMNYNKLEGYHVLADDVLIRDMWKTLGEPSGYIPRYALIDAEGNVAISHAARPSQGDALRNQILEIAGE